MTKDKLIIFDTTMRDGEQSPGASMTKEEKLRIARQLERMRVDVIEAGFPAASDGDFEAVKAVADNRQGQHGVRAGARQRAATSAAAARRCGAARNPARAHLHRDLADPHGEQAAHGAVAGDRAGGEGGEVGARVYRQCRILAGGRRPLGRRFSVPHPRAGDQGRRDHHQRSRHRRLHAARAFRRPHPHPARAHSRIPTRRCGRCTATTTSGSRSPIRWRRC